MQIVNATSNHVSYIANSLSKHFSDANHVFGYPKYKEDIDIMMKHVSKRVSDPDSEFMYLVCTNEKDEPIGFVNLTVNEYNTGSILMIIGENSDIIRDLTNESLSYFKERGVKNIQIEVLQTQKDVLNILKEVGIQEQLINFRIII